LEYKLNWRRFHTLAWSQLGASVGKSHGLLAGGKENGEVDIYDPYAIITGKSKDPVAKHAAFSGPVKGLDFSPLNPGMLATGGPDGEVFVVALLFIFLKLNVFPGPCV
jgi:protein transport protein SEC31